ncbi:uncharacterized protein LOC116173177 [Photinus pyralis]|nr:uncharacterized protein LOC116173177 [Photinus pyralis]
MESENVKERLNSLLQKKLSENERKSIEAENLSTSKEVQEDPVNKKLKKQERDEKNLEVEDPSFASADLFSQHLLHDILIEKKRALLRNKEVVEFIRSKIKD